MPFSPKRQIVYQKKMQGTVNKKVFCDSLWLFHVPSKDLGWKENAQGWICVGEVELETPGCA
jgi:hypothetical protein